MEISKKYKERCGKYAYKCLHQCDYRASLSLKHALSVHNLIFSILEQNTKLNEYIKGTCYSINILRGEIDTDRRKEFSSAKTEFNGQTDKRSSQYIDVIKKAELLATVENRKIGLIDLLMSALSNHDTIRGFFLNSGIDINGLKKRKEDQIRKILEKRKAERSKNFNPLLTYGKELTANTQSIPNIIGREKELELLQQILLKKEKSNPLILGEAGAGKTALVKQLAHNIKSGNVSEALLGTKVFEIDLNALKGGASYRGDLEDRIHKLFKSINGIKEKVILFIDEIHLIGSSDSLTTISNLLKTYLTDGSVSIIGATTHTEYQRYLVKDKAIIRRFFPIYLKEPDVRATTLIIKGIKQNYEQYHNIHIDNKIVDAIISMADQYIHGKSFPDKALDLMDHACSLAKLDQNNNSHLRISHIEQSLQSYLGLKGLPTKLGDNKIETLQKILIDTSIDNLKILVTPLNKLISNITHYRESL